MTTRRRTATEAEVAEGILALDAGSRRVPAAEWSRRMPGLDAPGLYAWWADAEGAADLTASLEVDIRPGRIYAGLTGATKWPSGWVGRATLKSRIGGNHLGGRIAGSTFRLTLAAALLSALDLQVISSRKLEASSEQRLTEWMRRHLEVATFPFNDPDPLADLEDRVLGVLDPPLNLDGMPATPVRRRLAYLRQVVAQA